MPETTTTAGKRRNVDKDASTYWLSHAARLKIRAVARKRHLATPAFLEILAEELAQKYLSPHEIEVIEQEAEGIRAKRAREQTQ